MVILFTWINFLQNDLLDFLDLHSPLDLSSVVDEKKPLSRSTSVDKPCDNQSDSKYDASSAQSTDDSKRTREPDREKAEGGAVGATAELFDRRALLDIDTQSKLLPALLDFDAKEVEVVFNRTLFECEVCFMEKVGKVCLKFIGCDHVYCKECMKRYFEVLIKEGNVKGLICPDTKCESQANPVQVSGPLFYYSSSFSHKFHCLTD